MLRNRITIRKVDFYRPLGRMYLFWNDGRIQLAEVFPKSFLHQDDRDPYTLFTDEVFNHPKLIGYIMESDLEIVELC